ncbi:MAG: DsrE family protein [Halobacteria archaeon]
MAKPSGPGQNPRNVAFLVRHPPVASGWASEALRVAVGMTLAGGNRITVVFLGPGVLSLARSRPGAAGALEVREHIETLREMEVRLVAEEEACARHGIVPEGAEVADREAIAAILAEAEVLQSW